MDYNNNPDCPFSKGQDSCFGGAANMRKRSMSPKAEAEDINHRREGKMSKSTAEKNKAIVLEAFETLSISAITRRRKGSGHRITFSTVPTLRRDATDSL